MGVTAAMLADLPRYTSPVPIRSDHSLASFRCGKPSLDEWLRYHALGNESEELSRTYVVTDGGAAVVAYYSIATGSIEVRGLPRRMRHNKPNMVPVVILGRLAVDLDHAGQSLGSFMLREAMLRTLQVSETAAAYALLVKALDDSILGFYQRFGFQQSPISPTTLILPTKTIKAAIESP